MSTGQEICATVRTSYLVCYDICDDKRLRKVYETMRGSGDHLQYSVFECQFTAMDLARCRAELGKIIHHTEDQVLFRKSGSGRGSRGPGDSGAREGIYGHGRTLHHRVSER